MPPKRKKAAKKKKGKEPHNNNANSNNSSSSNSNNNNIQGNDDPRSQDERESDGGEVSSPLSQDSNQPPFSEGNEESDKNDPLSVQSLVLHGQPNETGNAEVSEKVGPEGDVVRIERDYSEDTESKDVHVEHVKSKESHDGNDSSSSGSSSSDDETKTIEEKWIDKAQSLKLNENSSNREDKAIDSEEMVEISENGKPLKGTNNAAVETAPVEDLLMPVEPMSETMKHIMEGSQVENTEVLEVFEPGLLINEEKILPPSNEATGSSPEVVLPEKNDDKVYPGLDDNVGASLNVHVSATDGNEGNILSPAVCRTETSSHTENLILSRSSANTVDRNEGGMLKSSDAQSPEYCAGATNAKVPETHEFSEEQHHVAPAPRVAQRTSWMSCCGILDVFTGSS